ncbi:MAG: hypothetical protein PHW50_00045 [Patescibacteria group bacterium]|nr:hypothetical protein [Patescibacteria group bacterium]
MDISVKDGLVTVRRGKNWIIFDENRALEVLNLAVSAWHGKYKHLINCDQPELVHLPAGFEYGSRMHGLYLFSYGSLNRYGEKTNVAIGEGSNIFNQHPWLIDPLLKYNEDLAGQKLGPVLAFTSAKTEGGKKEKNEKLIGWKFNLDLLRKDYDSDARNIFYQSSRNRAGLIKELSRFYGYGQKVAQLVALYFQDVEWQDHLNDWKDLKQIAVAPVDLWIAREMRNFNILIEWSTDKKNTASYIVSDFLVYMFNRYNLSWFEALQSLWHTGANICFKVSKLEQKAACHCLTLCPFHDYCVQRAGGSHQRNKGGFGWGNSRERSKNLFYQ